MKKVLALFVLTFALAATVGCGGDDKKPASTATNTAANTAANKTETKKP
jgi:hypothetical protein